VGIFETLINKFYSNFSKIFYVYIHSEIEEKEQFYDYEYSKLIENQSLEIS